jgi:hypothetical protein
LAVARIPDAELSRLKAEVSVERLVEGCGVVLRRQGKDLVGCCPFHEDGSPSLIVTPGKNLWHSLGASEMFSSGGGFAGQSIDDVAGTLRSGALSPKDVPIDVIVRDGNSLVLNTHSPHALIRAGVPRSWNVIDRTGQAANESRLTGQLTRKGSSSYGTELP